MVAERSPNEATRPALPGRIIRFLSPMDRRWESKSSKALGLDAVIRFSGRVIMAPGGVRPSGG